jgi:hypothetical protein
MCVCVCVCVCVGAWSRLALQDKTTWVPHGGGSRVVLSYTRPVRAGRTLREQNKKSIASSANSVNDRF